MKKEKSKKDEKEDLREELKVKRTNLKNHIARLEGGFYKIGEKTLEVSPIDQEIKSRERDVRLGTIEIDNFKPLTPYFAFETMSEWQNLRKEKMKEVVDKNKEILNKVLAQKETILKEIPGLKTRINEIEKELGEEITKFDEEQTNYIG